jgi:hypothetical protein
MAQIAPNAFVRLLALRKAELGAAAMLRDGDDDYSDFFVEGSGPPWHEAFGDAGDDSERLIPASRMAFVDALRRVADDDGYSDFFVEGSGPPWHEAFGDAGPPDPERPAWRARALGSMRVPQAYALAKEGVRELGAGK